MPEATAELSAFTGGLLMVTTATPSVFGELNQFAHDSFSIDFR